MNLIAIIPSGQTEITVNGLHQWDYGQTLEIHSNDLSPIIEVHFACSGMTEAVVRSCSVSGGVTRASIPDRCIEQTTPIVAWVYCIDGTSARTVATIKLPIIARAKPAPGASIPEVITDKYTELVSAINEQVATLKEGNVTVANAIEAGHATSADQATNATNATNADTATNANHAQSSGKWNLSKDNPTATYNIGEGYADTTDPLNEGLYLAVFTSASGECTYSGIGYIGEEKGASEEVAVGYKIALGEIYASFSCYNSWSRIRIDKIGDTAEDRGSRRGILKLYTVATFAEGQEVIR